MKIGLLGGLGPESTGEFYLKFISTLQKKGFIKKNEDYPHIIINSIPAPVVFMDNAEITDYKKGIKDLEKFGCDFIAILCNTAHVHYDEFKELVKIPIINLRKEVKNYLDENDINSVIVFGTHKTIKKGLFKYEDKNYEELSNEEMEVLDEAVNNFNGGFEKEKQIEIVRGLAEKYLKNVGMIISGCTEIALMLKDTDFKNIDTMDVLLEAIIKKWKNIEF
jgi:aspartate racemase